MWELSIRAEVRACLRALEFQAKTRHGRPTGRGGTVYFGKHSRRSSLKFYGKGDELDARGKGHRLPLEIEHRDKLYDYADNKVRGELPLRQMQLNTFRLDRDTWILNPGIAQDLLLEHIGSLEMFDQFSFTPELLDELPPRLILVYKAWRTGEDTRAMLPARTFYRIARNSGNAVSKWRFVSRYKTQMRFGSSVC
jgi:II/X family phage/plasmid replication protein